MKAGQKLKQQLATGKTVAGGFGVYPAKDGKAAGPKKPGGILGPKKPGKGDMMSKPVKQPVVKKPVKGGPKEQGTGKVFKTPEKAQEDKKQAAPVQTLKKGGMACKKYARGGGIEVRGKTKGKFI